MTVKIYKDYTITTELVGGVWQCEIRYDESGSVRFLHCSDEDDAFDRAKRFVDETESLYPDIESEYDR